MSSSHSQSMDREVAGCIAADGWGEGLLSAADGGLAVKEYAKLADLAYKSTDDLRAYAHDNGYSTYFEKSKGGIRFIGGIADALTDDGSLRGFVVFRGTEMDFPNSILNWMTNANCALDRLSTTICSGHDDVSARVHSGFQRAYLKNAMHLLWNELAKRTDILSYTQPSFMSSLDKVIKRPKTQLTFIGHSLGGALATLAAIDFAAHGLHNGLLATFGAPRLGDKAFKEVVSRLLPNGRTARFAHLLDLVPHLPLSMEDENCMTCRLWKKLSSLLPGNFEYVDFVHATAPDRFTVCIINTAKRLLAQGSNIDPTNMIKEELLSHHLMSTYRSRIDSCFKSMLSICASNLMDISPDLMAKFTSEGGVPEASLALNVPERGSSVMAMTGNALTSSSLSSVSPVVGVAMQFGTWAMLHRMRTEAKEWHAQLQSGMDEISKNIQAAGKDINRRLDSLEARLDKQESNTLRGLCLTIQQQIQIGKSPEQLLVDQLQLSVNKVIEDIRARGMTDKHSSELLACALNGFIFELMAYCSRALAGRCCQKELCSRAKQIFNLVAPFVGEWCFLHDSDPNSFASLNVVAADSRTMPKFDSVPYAWHSLAAQIGQLCDLRGDNDGSLLLDALMALSASEANISVVDTSLAGRQRAIVLALCLSEKHEDELVSRLRSVLGNNGSPFSWYQKRVADKNEDSAESTFSLFCQGLCLFTSEASESYKEVAQFWNSAVEKGMNFASVVRHLKDSAGFDILHHESYLKIKEAAKDLVLDAILHEMYASCPTWMISVGLSVNLHQAVNRIAACVDDVGVRSDQRLTSLHSVTWKHSKDLAIAPADLGPCWCQRRKAQVPVVQSLSCNVDDAALDELYEIASVAFDDGFVRIFSIATGETPAQKLLHEVYIGRAVRLVLDAPHKMFAILKPMINNPDVRIWPLDSVRVIKHGDSALGGEVRLESVDHLGKAHVSSKQFVGSPTETVEASSLHRVESKSLVEYIRGGNCTVELWTWGGTRFCGALDGELGVTTLSLDTAKRRWASGDCRGTICVWRIEEIGEGSPSYHILYSVWNVDVSPIVSVALDGDFVAGASPVHAKLWRAAVENSHWQIAEIGSLDSTIGFECNAVIIDEANDLFAVGMEHGEVALFCRGKHFLPADSFRTKRFAWNRDASAFQCVDSGACHGLGQGRSWLADHTDGNMRFVDGNGILCSCRKWILERVESPEAIEIWSDFQRTYAGY